MPDPQERRAPLGSAIARFIEALLFASRWRRSMVRGLVIIDGFVVIQSSHSLDVTAVYTTALLDEKGRATAHSSIDVEQVAERRPDAER